MHVIRDRVCGAGFGTGWACLLEWPFCGMIQFEVTLVVAWGECVLPVSIWDSMGLWGWQEVSVQDTIEVKEVVMTSPSTN